MPLFGQSPVTTPSCCSQDGTAVLHTVLILGWPLAFRWYTQNNYLKSEKPRALLGFLQPASTLLQDCEVTLCDPSQQAPRRIQKGLASWVWKERLERMGLEFWLRTEPLGGGNLESFADLT